MTRPLFDLNAYQSILWRAYKTPTKKILAGIAGAQGGKTSFGARWLVREFWNNKGKGYNYVVVAPNYKIMNQSIIPTWESVSHKLQGRLNKQEMSYALPDGGHVFFRTATDPDSVIGTPNVKAAWIDECGKVSRAAYYAVVERLARLEGTLLLTTTPYAMNWVAKEIIIPAERGQREDVLYVRWRSLDNPAYPQSAWDAAKQRLPTRIFRMRYEGFHDKAEGLIHADWDEHNWIEPFKLPLDTKYYMGIDWGWDHPMSIVVRAITPESECYDVSFFKRSGLSTTQQIDQIVSKAKMYNSQMAFCGHDRPDMIAELNMRGIAAVNYFAFNNNLREVVAGDQKLSELVKSKRYRAFKGIDQWMDFEDEMQTYVWDKDPDEETIVKERPANSGAFDLLAAARYVTCGTVGFLKEPVLKLVVPFGVSEHVDRGITPNKKGHWSSY